jgi:4-amino-4-deoxy-L-arabinose transferase-like glycosyltransferase
MDKNNKFILILIFVLAFAIRIYHANSYPTLLWDEASLGYNAFSIIHTAKDEYGKLLPLIFKSFGDYKPGLYVYLAIPFIKILGLTTLAVRLPSIIIGSLTPIILYLLIKEISPKSKKIALISALVLTFNPYNIHFSKGAWETNILTFELVLATLFFFKFFKNSKKIYLFLSALVFASTLYTYQAGKMISVLLILILVAVNFKSIFQKHLKTAILSFVLPLGLLAIPVAYGLLFSSNANRLNVISLLSYPRSQTETQQIINETNKTDYNIFYNQGEFFLRNSLLRYFNHFSPKFLAFEGDWQDARNSAPYIGVILYPSLIFLVIGIFLSLSKEKKEPVNLFFLLWLLAAPIPAALTRDSIQAVRSMSFSIPLVYFISLGIFFFLNKYKSKFALLLLIGVCLISFVYYGDLYLNHMSKKSPNDTLYGYKEAANFVIQNQSKYQNIVFTDFYGQPYIYYLFFSQYPPEKYQAQAKLTESISGDTGRVEKIDNIQFTSTNFQYVTNTPHTLGIFSYDEILRQNLNTSKDFSKFIPLSPINGISTFYAYENP